VNLVRKICCVVAVALPFACAETTQAPSVGIVGLSSDVSALNNDGSLAHVTASVTDAAGRPATGSISFLASVGDLNGTGTTAATLALDAAGHATVTYACDFTLDPTHCGAGSVVVTASWSTVANGTRVTLQGPSSAGTDAGPPSGGTDAGPIVVGPAGPAASVTATASAPAALGLKGSGIQETGVTTFLVADASGRAVSGATVAFGQRQPVLVTLAQTSAVTAADGTVSVGYNAGAQVGITAITATVAATGASGSKPIAVRGAKPSASGFYFHCNHINLPVYTTTLEYETTDCVVRLSDRYGNRVGISTPVYFAAETGAITASAMTKPFDVENPADPEEGSLTVTFSSDIAGGFGPVVTTPFAADATQYPRPRSAEPFQGSANPRDQLVTIIAMVRGEEAFVDGNLNGQYDSGELFVDQGDPFIDANDDNAYDPVTEPRFCGGASCAAYNLPNGVWDSDRTIWAPTWVVFTAVGGAIFTPLSPASCADYADNNGINPSLLSSSVRVLDPWLNLPTLGTTFAVKLTAPKDGLKLTAFGGADMLDNLGSMDLTREKVSAANPTLACTVANTVNGACIVQTEFGLWDDGSVLAFVVDNSNKVPAAVAPGHACGTPTAGTHLANFTVDVTVTGPHASSVGTVGGAYGY
jgi:hypothetical protein